MTKNAQINAYPTADKKAPLTFYVKGHTANENKKCRPEQRKLSRRLTHPR
jgi:hypothetical protein